MTEADKVTPAEGTSEEAPAQSHGLPEADDRLTAPAAPREASAGEAEAEVETEPRVRSASVEGAPKVATTGMPAYLAEREASEPEAAPAESDLSNEDRATAEDSKEGSEEYTEMLQELYRKEAEMLTLPKRSLVLL